VTLFAVEGAAGCGKTHRLIAALEDRLGAVPLNEGQRVLALTFMHGARLRLHEKLRSVPGLGRHVECITVDSFAQRLLRRWRSLVSALGHPAFRVDQYELQCDVAGALLERPEVAAWAQASFPIVLVDEAQDLRPERLRMIRALSARSFVLVAADEFQCLDPALRPNPTVAWLRGAGEPEVLQVVRRTDVGDLLAAARAIRQGQAPQNAQRFRLMSAPSVHFAAAMLANGIAWRNGGNVAVITPSLVGDFVRDTVAKVTRQACGRQGNGPFAISWDRSERDALQASIAGLEMPEHASAAATTAALQRLPTSFAVRQSIAWVERQVRTRGVENFRRPDVVEIIGRNLSQARQRASRAEANFTAMTVQQAKNREFDGVFVLWPYQVGGDDEHKRRLLYNAVTRARNWCTVVAQGPSMPRSAPFV
jgi:hypothetical protein